MCAGGHLRRGRAPSPDRTPIVSISEDYRVIVGDRRKVGPTLRRLEIFGGNRLADAIDCSCMSVSADLEMRKSPTGSPDGSAFPRSAGGPRSDGAGPASVSAIVVRAAAEIHWSTPCGIGCRSMAGSRRARAYVPMIRRPVAYSTGGPHSAQVGRIGDRAGRRFRARSSPAPSV